MTLPAYFALVAALGVAAFCFAHFFDRDAGGYVDAIGNKATYPKKAIHAAFGALLAFTLARLMPIELALASVALIGAAYERGQGFFSWLDLAADVAGAFVACGYYQLTGGAFR